MSVHNLNTTINLINLLPSATFTSAVTGWSFPPVTVTYSNTGANFTTAQAWLSLSQTTRVPYIVGHKMYFYATVQSDQDTAVGIRWFSGTDYSTFLNQSLFIKAFTTEETVSAIWQYDDTTTTGWDFTFQSITENTTNMRIKEAMVIDLTAFYGAGNEPTKEWCDKNIPLFQGEFCIIDNLVTSDIVNCPYEGFSKVIKLPKGVYKLECWGAQGGKGSATMLNAEPGNGGYSSGLLTLKKATTLYLYAGGAGLAGRTNSGDCVLGGFNGGGNSGYTGVGFDSNNPGGGGSGGGGTDIRIGTDSLYARVIVAGGGGGSGISYETAGTGGAGGGTSGMDGHCGFREDLPAGSNTPGDAGGGGTQTRGGVAGIWTSSSEHNGTAGSFGIGGFGNTVVGQTQAGAGGGGGWYGGGAGAGGYSFGSGGGGGGSGYVYNTANATNYPTGCLLNSDYYLADASTVDGNTSFLSPDNITETGHLGNGYIRITVIKNATPAPNIYDVGTSMLGINLTNIIGDSSFENDAWGGANYSTTEKYVGNRSLYFPVGTTYVPHIEISRPIVGHKYYGRRYIKSNGDNQPADCRFEVWGADGENKNWVYAWNTGNHPEWEFHSAIHEIASVDYPETDRTIIRCFNVNTTADTWVDGLMLIDLTEAFGAGNEPSKAWCDRLPYFEGTFIIPPILKKGDIINCSYSGRSQQVILPKGTYKLECWGAQGGSYNTTYQGGKGGYSQGVLTLTADETELYLYTGQQNNNYGTSAGNTSGNAFNGGGYGKTVYYKSTYTYSCAGGGASDIRIGQDSLYARVIVAGGGSGSTNGSQGYYGGGLTSGGYNTTYQATQTAAGSLGSFGVGANSNPSSTNYRYASAGGGGGWYGGGSSTSYNDSSATYRQYHGGGSGYVYTPETAVNYPSGCLLNESYYLSRANTIAGNNTFNSPDGIQTVGNSGNGYIRITVIENNESTPKAYLGLQSIKTGYLGNLKIINFTSNNQYANYGYTIISKNIFPITGWVKNTNNKYTTDTGYIIESDSSQSANPPYCASDGNVDLAWRSAIKGGGSSELWIMMTLNEPAKITKMKIKINADTESYFAYAKIQGSNDATTWTELYKTTSIQRSLSEVILSSTNYYKYYRIALNTSSGAVLVYEWQTSECIEKIIF